MRSAVPVRPLPPWVTKGMMVFPERSYVSRKEYTGMGMSYHQMGYPRKIVS